ncbi:MAG: autotransporter domain-containing protein [Rhizobiales bacterium]|nr:autotransporter domain-containing protein [Hyphomicrobiales bacterium]
MRRRRARTLVLGLLASTAFVGAPAMAQDGTWSGTPGSGDMLEASNWSPAGLPGGTATFGASTVTTLTLGEGRTFDGWTFATGAPAYSITMTGVSKFTGAGIVVNGATPTITNNGSISFLNSSSAGAAAFVNKGALLFYGTSTLGSATVTGTGEVVFLNDSKAGSATITTSGFYGVSFYGNSSAESAIITSSSVSFFENSTAGSANITGTGQIYFAGSSTAGNAVIVNGNNYLFNLTFTGSASAGTATITNGGNMNFYASSTAGGASITNTNIAAFNNTSTAGSATIVNSGIFYFYDSSTAGGANISSSNAINFSGTSTAGKATIANTGSLSFFDSSTAGSAAITNDNFLSFGWGSTAGSATITNTANGWISVYGSTGTATITSSGVFWLRTADTTGTATVTIERGELSGFGSIGNTTIKSGGFFSPEDGTLKVNGDLSLAAGSTWVMQRNGVASVTGMVTLGGGGLRVRQTGFKSYSQTLVNATGGVSGTFALDANTAAIASVAYGTHDIVVTVNGFRVGQVLQGAGSTNARNVGAGIDRGMDASGGVGPAAFDQFMSYSAPNLARVLARLSGEAGTVPQSTGLAGVSTFLGMMLDPMGGSRGGTASAPGSSLIEMADLGAARTPAAQVEQAWSIWTRAYGQAARTASDAGLGATGTASSIYGVAAGADKLVSPGLVVGFALAGGGTVFGPGSPGSGTGDFLQIGAYASTRLGPGYLSGAVAYGWNRFDMTRTAGIIGAGETYRSSMIGHTFGGRVEAGRRFALGSIGTMHFAVTPYAAAEAIAFVAPGYRETWAAPATGAFALAYAGRTTGTLRAEFGARADTLVASAESGDLIAFSKLGYAVQSNTQRAAEAQFQALASSSFTVFGSRASTHTALGTLGIEARFRQGFAASLALDGEVGERHRALKGSVALRQSW